MAMMQPLASNARTTNVLESFRPKLRVVGRRFSWLSWGFGGFGVVVFDYAAVSGMGALMRVKARRWSGVGSVSMGISVVVCW
jgi:hypothetical protein